MYQPVAEDTADAVILVIEQERVTMVEDPYSESAAQHKRYIAAVRVPRHRWLCYEYYELLSLHLLQLTLLHAGYTECGFVLGVTF